jgi:rod shape-determining protein MreB
MFHRLTDDGAPTAIAIDLGTARTRVSVPAEGIYLDEPTVIAFDQHGDPVAAGWDAWHAGVEGSVTLRYPVRRGLIVDPVMCVQFLKTLLRQAAIVPSSVAAVAVPTLSLPYDVDVLLGCVKAATGAEVMAVDVGVAAAAAAASTSTEPAGIEGAHLVCDLGAGLIEVTAAWRGGVWAAARAEIGAQEYLERPSQVLAGVITAVQVALNQFVAPTARMLDSRPLRLIGGGTLLPGLTHDIAQRCDTQVQIPDDPRSCVIGGLTAHLSSALASA